MAMQEKKETHSGLRQKQLEQVWRREMGLPFRVGMLLLVLLTYCCSMAAIGIHNGWTVLRRTWRSRF